MKPLTAAPAFFVSAALLSGTAHPSWSAEPKTPWQDSGSRTATAVAPSVTRYGGATRYQVAVNTSRGHWRDANASAGNSAEVAVIVPGNKFEEGVAAIPLAKAKRGPVLLTEPESLNAYSRMEIQRILPAGATVYIAGGTGAISPAIDQEISAMGYTVKRYFGATAREVSLKIARDGVANPRHVTIASQKSWMDSLSAATAVAAADGALVLSNDGALDSATKSWLDGLPSTVTVTTVGTGARSAYTSTDGPVFGDTEIETNTLIAEKFTPDPTRFGLTTTNYYTDGLSGGAYAATVGMPMILTPPTTLDLATSWSAVDHSSTTTNVTLFGGTGSLTEGLSKDAQTASTEKFITGEIVPPGETAGDTESVKDLVITPDWALDDNGSMRASGYSGGMNEAEFSFCKWPSRYNICNNARKSANLAQAYANAEGMSSGAWPGSAGNGGRKDAFRHCIWNGHMTMQMGTKTAKGFGDRHEKGPTPPGMTKETAQAHHRMDYHNNARGRFYGEHAKKLMVNPGLTFDQAYATMRTWCLLSVNDGELHKMKP